MKRTLTSCLIAATLMLASCALAKGLTLEPIGPAAPAPTAKDSTGVLKVYSAYDVHEINAGDYEHRFHYSDYRIMDADGKLLRRVHNDTDTVAQAPATVSLAPGSYTVVVHSNGYGLVTVPVVIEAHRLTALHLDGGAPTGPQADAVRLPDGEIVGVHATTTASAASYRN